MDRRPTPAEIGPVDVVLVSHGHPDHLDRRSLAAHRRIPDRGRPAPSGCRGPALARVRGRRAPGWGAPRGPRHLRSRRSGQSTGSRPAHLGRSRSGYLVGDRSAVWFAGDTARYPEMVALRGRVDVALLPVWTWGPHLGPGPPRTRGRGRRRRGRGRARRRSDPLGHALSAPPAPAVDGPARRSRATASRPRQPGSRRRPRSTSSVPVRGPLCSLRDPVDGG